MDLKSIPTTDLIKELESRAGVKKISVGPYSSYRLKRLYSRDRSPYEPDLVLVVDDLNQLESL